VVKIITGKYAKRNINFIGRTRPPLTKIRQYIFDILQHHYAIEGAIVLDICAGSGSLGLEALSRGASYCYFVEENHQTAANLQNTLQSWGVDNAKILVLNALYLPVAQVKVDIVFMDPPFGHGNLTKIMNRIVKKGWIDGETILIARTEEVIQPDPAWQQLSHNRIGISNIYFLKLVAQSEL